MLPILPCPHGQGTAIGRHGTTRQGKHRSRCREQPCAGRPFLRDASDPGPAPEVKQQSVERALKARGLRATARVLPIRTKTVMTE